MAKLQSYFRACFRFILSLFIVNHRSF
jgi:hypothetical protein